MSKIGLRYPPARETDPKAHAAMLALLASDIAHLDPKLVERATSDWVARKPYMPKASDLIDLCSRYLTENQRGSDAALQRLREHCEMLNARNTGRFYYIAGESPNRYVDSKELV